ncbi:ABC transporter permease subunit [Kaistia granuli]|uniref:ABC transporter permease subunit n=1 Tax=Kaistia granuli TaxID=363259 RepID=UPI00035D9DF4|nr:ABC transporter permease subunit [Kaistia granuli]
MSLDLAEAALAPSRPAERAGPTKAAPRNRPVVAITAALTIASLVLAWAIASHFQLVSALFLPSPVAVGKAFVTVARDGFVDATLWQHLAASLGRVFAALVGATLIAVPIGFAIGSSAVGRGTFDPIIEFLRPIPPLAYLPLVIIWFGIGEPSKILIIGIAMLAPIVISTATGVKGVDADRLNAARSLGATRRQLLRHVILPGSLPAILTGIRIALGAGWSTLVAAELVAASRGLGFMIQSAAQFLVTDVVLMGILVIAAVAFALEAVLRWIERRLVPWAGKS